MLSGAKKEDTEAQKQGKKKRPDCARAMYFCELNLVHGNAALREECIFFIANTLGRAFHMIFNKACQWLSHVRRPSAGF